jgi:hypothetical protein
VTITIWMASRIVHENRVQSAQGRCARAEGNTRRRLGRPNRRGVYSRNAQACGPRIVPKNPFDIGPKKIRKFVSPIQATGTGAWPAHGEAMRCGLSRGVALRQPLQRGTSTTRQRFPVRVSRTMFKFARAYLSHSSREPGSPVKALGSNFTKYTSASLSSTVTLS